MILQTCSRRIEDAFTRGTSPARSYPRARRDFTDRLVSPRSGARWDLEPRRGDTVVGVPQGGVPPLRGSGTVAAPRRGLTPPPDCVSPADPADRFGLNGERRFPTDGGRNRGAERPWRGVRGAKRRERPWRGARGSCPETANGACRCVGRGPVPRRRCRCAVCPSAPSGAQHKQAGARAPVPAPGGTQSPGGATQ